MSTFSIFVLVLGSITSIASYVMLIVVMDNVRTIYHMTTELLKHNFGDCKEEVSNDAK